MVVLVIVMVELINKTIVIGIGGGIVVAAVVVVVISSSGGNIGDCSGRTSK